MFSAHPVYTKRLTLGAVLLFMLCQWQLGLHWHDAEHADCTPCYLYAENDSLLPIEVADSPAGAWNLVLLKERISRVTPVTAQLYYPRGPP